jgi:hypothetical protein
MLVGFANTLPWGLGLFEGNMDVYDVPPPLKNMTWKQPSYITLITHDPPSLWGNLGSIGKIKIDQCVMQT